MIRRSILIPEVEPTLTLSTHAPVRPAIELSLARCMLFGAMSVELAHSCSFAKWPQERHKLRRLLGRARHNGLLEFCWRLIFVMHDIVQDHLRGNVDHIDRGNVKIAVSQSSFDCGLETIRRLLDGSWAKLTPMNTHEREGLPRLTKVRPKAVRELCADRTPRVLVCWIEPADCTYIVPVACLAHTTKISVVAHFVSSPNYNSASW